jgi:hypothetical protein
MEIDTKLQLFEQIHNLCSNKITQDWIVTTKTSKGNTQNSERVVISKIKEVLNELSLTYTEAGSQQSKDFRNVGGIGLNIEVKKTDTPTIYFNDTCPSSDIYYIVIFTGNVHFPAQVLYLNGSKFLSGCDWIHEYIAELTALKDKYARGENKKKLNGIMSVYPRPTFKANISELLTANLQKPKLMKLPKTYNKEKVEEEHKLVEEEKEIIEEEKEIVEEEIEFEFIPKPKKKKTKKTITDKSLPKEEILHNNCIIEQLDEIGCKSIIDTKAPLDTQIIVSDNASNTYDNNTIMLTNDTENTLVAEAPQIKTTNPEIIENIEAELIICSKIN